MHRSPTLPARSSTRPDIVQLAHATIGRHRIRYGVRRGSAAHPPLLFFNGLGANIELAQPFVDALRAPTIVIFDVPGVGGSSPARVPYRPRHIAGIAGQLLDRLGFGVVDVLGVSWGGAIAQQFAFSHAKRTRKLVLAATAPGVTMIPGRPSVLAKMLTPRRYVDAVHAYDVAGDIYGGVFRTDRAAITRTLRHIRFSSRSGYYLQLAAACGWTSLPWLWMLRQPTLILAGGDDPIVPAINARIMRRLMPDARLAIVDDGHLFLVTKARESARLVGEFLH